MIWHFALEVKRIQQQLSIRNLKMQLLLLLYYELGLRVIRFCQHICVGLLINRLRKQPCKVRQRVQGK